MTTPLIDFNLALACASEAFSLGKFRDALAIYLRLAQGDESLDGGTLGYNISRCYNEMGDGASSLYWIGRAINENPTIEEHTAYVNEINHVDINSIVDKYRHAYNDQFGLSRRLRARAEAEGRDVWP